MVEARSKDLCRAFVAGGCVSVKRGRMSVRFLGTRGGMCTAGRSLMVGRVGRGVRACRTLSRRPLSGQGVSLVTSRVMQFTCSVGVKSIVVVPSFGSSSMDFNIVRDRR